MRLPLYPQPQKRRKHCDGAFPDSLQRVTGNKNNPEQKITNALEKQKLSAVG